MFQYHQVISTIEGTIHREEMFQDHQVAANKFDRIISHLKDIEVKIDE